MDVEIHLTLTVEENSLFLMMQGMAAGVAMHSGQEKLAHAVLRLVNKINAGKPEYTPYSVPED
jgi:hypothetical protein